MPDDHHHLTLTSGTSKIEDSFGISGDFNSNKKQKLSSIGDSLQSSKRKMSAKPGSKIKTPSKNSDTIKNSENALSNQDDFMHAYNEVKNSKPHQTILNNATNALTNNNAESKIKTKR